MCVGRAAREKKKGKDKQTIYSAERVKKTRQREMLVASLQKCVRQWRELSRTDKFQAKKPMSVGRIRVFAEILMIR